jgi:hypothetical protein
MKTKPTYPGRALTPLSLLLLPLARVSLSLSMASHHCESFRNSWHTLMNWLERLEQGVSDEKEIKQWIYLNSSWNSKGALLSNATECFKHQIEHRDSFLVLRRHRLISNYGAIELEESSSVRSRRRQWWKGKPNRCSRGQIEWWKGLFRSKRCYLAWIQRAIEWRDSNFIKGEDETEMQLRNLINLSAIESEGLPEVMKRCLNTIWQ